MVFQPVKLWIILIILSGIVWIIQYCFKRIEARRKALTAIRVIIFLLLLFILFQPARTVYKHSSKKPVIAFLVDSSMSMKTKDATSRFHQVKKFFGEERGSRFNTIMHELGGRYKPLIFTFSGSSQRTTIANISKSNPEGRKTDIGLAIRQVEKEMPGNILNGVILISDGAHNGAFSPVESAMDCEVPVYTIGVGDPGKYIDLQVSKVEAPEFAFKNTPTNVEVTLSGFGFAGWTVPVILKNVDGILQTKKVKIKSNNEKTKIAFSFVPKRVGTFKYTVNIPTYGSEVSHKNNARKFTMQVVRDKIRIMYICGQPSWEYSFLRNALKADPTLDFVSFNILRNPENVTIVPESQLALIPFPIREIFTKEIYNFDLLVFENFKYSRFRITHGYLDNIRKFVKEYGGAFLMLGGDNSFGKGGYKSTPLYEILPVELSGNDEKISLGTFSMRVNRYSHPIVQLSNDPKENRKIWESMPDLDSCNQLLKPKPGAVLLGSHPMAANEYGNLPVLCVWDAGKGRVMTMASNTTWRWSFQLAAEGKGNYYYNRFWSQAIRWLIQAEDMKLVHLSADKKVFMRDEEIKLNVRVFDKYYRPNNGVSVYVSVINPSGKKIDLGIIPAVRKVEGRYEADYAGNIEGSYKFRSEAYKGGIKLGADELTCEVAVPTIELEDPQLNEPLLRDISEASGGKYFNISSISEEEIKFPEREKKAATALRKVSVWNSAFIFTLICALLTVQWYLRRKNGML